MENNLIWIDGNYFEKNDAKIAALSQTFHYGFGVYEGIRSYEINQEASIFRLKDHTDRLFQSAQLLGITIPYEKETINDALCNILLKNHLANAYLRPVVFMGDEFLGLHTQLTSVHLMIAAIKWNDFYVSKEQMKKGVSIKTASHERLALKNGLQKAKANGLYLISILANNEARAAGCDEALLLDPKGYVAEGSGANIFIIKNKILYTPFLDFALDGITRRTIIQLAKDQNIPVVEKNITLAELYCADEVFFCGTAAEVLAVTQVDGKKIGSGEMGERTEAMQNAYREVTTGKNAHYQHWLTHASNREKVLLY
ncbi:MAG: branched chain amino acid aminotransferase [Gammaproteobacteria bacterium CG_4_10_14_0_8_um_filter_38_16]|nr:MAG: branched chain amino acid aminotransferase [Gammaproteobacteria bacterium CG_4_10_14_0_8_um_filter_38_16]PJA03175.1 MAG: branched chain amino acid aminotransferase [Gammaproteobacteria bacterium CG_4_10_14_0_2_um_filter_38_22]PJB09967.1 MAG: branched chain amino acid aminotransferase [Gammaproteobacteria bacterium CG_4_9_14_3_um_filter_38_9]